MSNERSTRNDVTSRSFTINKIDDRKHAEDRIRSLPLWSAPPRISPIEAGRTNQNFLVTYGKHRYFARVGVDIPIHGIRRTIEARLAKYAASHGLAPTVHYAEHGIIVTDYIDARVLSASDSYPNEILERIAKRLSHLHNLPIQKDIPIFDPVDISRFYLDKLMQKDFGINQRTKIENILKVSPKLDHASIIHADLIPENFIDDGDKMWIIDWEYAGLGHPSIDIASVAMNFDLSNQELETLVKYHGNLDPEIVRRIIPVLAAREALWCLIQLQENGTPQGDLLEYTQLCLNRLGIEE